MRKYPKTSIWQDRYAPVKLQLRLPERVRKVCKLEPGMTVEWRIYKNGVNGFRATIQQVKNS